MLWRQGRAGAGMALQQPRWLPQRKPEASVEIYARRHCSAELCVEETLGKTGLV